MVTFTDSYGETCSIQASSIARHVWLGIDGVKAQVLHGDARKLGVTTDATSGWVPYPIPQEVRVTTRMHLEREKVQALVNHLQAWLDSDTGQFTVSAGHDAPERV